VSVAGARNAGLLAARILGAGEGDEATRIRAALADFRADLGAQARAKGAALRDKVSGEA
jgi:5-(carboxyamino)imidazole ribonucleotide mutase